MIAARQIGFGKAGGSSTITATVNCTNALQVKDWIEAECAARGYTGVYITIVHPANFVEGDNQVISLSVNTDGICNSAVRQRSNTFVSLTPLQLTTGYDAKVNIGDVFALLNTL